MQTSTNVAKTRSGLSLFRLPLALVCFATACGPDTSTGNDDEDESSDDSSESDHSDDVEILRFEWEKCPTTALQTTGAQCAQVAVPLDWEDDESETIELFVHKTEASADEKKGMLWILDGGPGGNGESLAAEARSLFGDTSAYDLYVVSHRGTGRSTLLECEAFESSGSGDIRDCVAELAEKWGDGLAHFNSRQAGMDLGQLIDTVHEDGDSINVYGVSYGTYWAQRYLQQFPDQADLVVLDGVLDLKAEVWLNNILAEEAGNRVYDEFCQASEACTKVTGDDPLSYYTDLIDTLREDGIACEPLKDWETSDVVDAHTLLARYAGYLPNLGPSVVGLTQRIKRCNASDQEQLQNFLSFYEMLTEDSGETGQADFSIALYANVVTNDLVGYLDEWPSEAIDEFEGKLYFANSAETSFEMLYDNWPHEAVADDHLKMPKTEVPMLLVNGGLDFQTVLPWAERAAEHFSGDLQNYVYVPVGGHGLVVGKDPAADEPSSCLQDVFAQVLAEPMASPDTSCTDDFTALDFAQDQAATGNLAQAIFGVSDVFNPADDEAAKPVALLDRQHIEAAQVALVEQLRAIRPVAAQQLAARARLIRD
jgi:pimeloyl-ACP methyl ester carboxylesterase